MDFMNRGAQQPAHTNKQPSVNQSSAAAVSSKPNKQGKLFKISAFLLLVCATVLIVGSLLVLAFGSSDSADNEAKLVQKNALQAVFLTNGQVYFGNITAVNSKYINLIDIYYLTTNQQVQPNSSSSSSSSSSSVSLVKLGCELHAPEDQMTINREQVTFWENLKSDGQVAKAVANYKQQNPNQTCTQTQQQSTNSSSTGTTTKQ